MFFKVNGQVNLAKLPSHTASLNIVCWDKDILADDKLGETTIDGDGQFSFLLALSDSGEVYPELYFKVMYGDEELFTSSIYDTRGLLDKNEITGFIEQTTLDLGCIN